MRPLRVNVNKVDGIQTWGSEEIPVGRNRNVGVLCFRQACGYGIPGNEECSGGVWVNSKLYWLSRKIEQTGEPAECGVISQGKMKFQRKGVGRGSIVVKLDECF